MPDPKTDAQRQLEEWRRANAALERIADTLENLVQCQQSMPAALEPPAPAIQAIGPLGKKR